MTAAMHLSGIHSSGNSGNGGSGEPGLPRKNGPERPATILVVEDEILIRLAVADFLREQGYRVLEAASGAEAQKVLASAEPVQLVFSDVTMPGPMDGLGLAAWIRAELPAVEVILTSGVASVVRAGRQIATFFEKPYNFEALVAEIRRLIGR